MKKTRTKKKTNRDILFLVLRPLVLGLALLFLFLGLHRTNSLRNYGIDVSEHQGKIKWGSVSDSGVSFAVIRCGYRSYDDGSLHLDDRFKRNMHRAWFCSIHRGVYFYSQATNVEEAQEEAAFVLDAVGSAKLQYPIFLDVEDTGTEGAGRADGLTPAARTKVVQAFCDAIEAEGYEAGVYSNAWFLQNSLNADDLTGVSFWVAEYVDGSQMQLWTGDWDLWQYTQEGEVSGIEGTVDLNRYPLT